MIDLEHSLRPQFPYHELLRDLARLRTPDGRLHLVDGPEGAILCGEERTAEAEVDTAWRGEDAWRLATCSACKLAGERIVAGAGIERLAAEQQAGPLGRMIAADVDGDRERVSTEALKFEERNYAWFWLCLFAAVVCVGVGAVSLGLLAGIAGATMRLMWLSTRPKIGYPFQ